MKYQNSNFRSAFNRFQTFSMAAVAVLVAILAISILYAPEDARAQTASASSSQIIRTARIELTDAKKKVPIGRHMYLTADRMKQLTHTMIASRHQKNTGGIKQEGETIRLSSRFEPTWLLFSVTNNSSKQDWVLNFGSVLGGRMAVLQNLEVKDHPDGHSYITAPDTEAEPWNRQDLFHGTALPLKIPIGKTKIFTIYTEPSGNFPNTIHPELIEAEAYIKESGRSGPVTEFYWLFLVGAFLFFVTFSRIDKNTGYLIFSGYYLLHLMLFSLLNSIFYTSLALAGPLLSLIFVLSALAGLIMTRSFLNISPKSHGENIFIFVMGAFVFVSAWFNLIIRSNDVLLASLLIFVPVLMCYATIIAISYLQLQQGKDKAYYYCLAWIGPLVGCLVAGLAGGGLLPANHLFLNAYWIGLLPQFILLATAVLQRHEGLKLEENNEISYNLSHPRSRLKKSKETADQARLLRVIERERELMSELREREILRSDEMRRAKDMADAANNAKSAFLAVVSHEIRTPMTGIMGMVKLLKDTKLNSDQSEYLLAIQKSGDAMMSLLNDILDFEKIESGNMDLEEIDFHLPKLVQGVVTLMSGHAAEKKITLNFEISENVPPYVIGDPTRLRQVLLNLVNNAIKFTDIGHVTIRIHSHKVREDEETSSHPGQYEIYFAVEDTGIGVSETIQKDLFNPFEQADETVARRYGGTGLGLAISQKLVNAMGGRIRIESEENKGSTFFFSVIMKKGKEIASQETHTATDNFRTQKLKSQRVLVIEDNEINRKVLQSFLEKDGHEVTLTESGEEALNILGDQSFDAVFTDINLVGMNGVETTKAIRSFSDPSVRDIPIIAITANLGKKDQDDYKAAGMNGFIGKPIHYETLQQTLRDIVSNQTQKQEEVTDSKKPEKNEPVSRKKNPGNKESKDMTDVRAENPEPADPFEGETPLQKYVQSLEGEDMATMTPAPQAQDRNIINIAMLDKFLETIGKQKLLELLEGYYQKADEIVSALEAAKAGEHDIIKERAHELRGMASNFGMTHLSALAASIETSADSKDQKAAAKDIAALSAAKDESRKTMKVWLHAQPDSQKKDKKRKG